MRRQEAFRYAERGRWSQRNLQRACPVACVLAHGHPFYDAAACPRRSVRAFSLLLHFRTQLLLNFLSQLGHISYASFVICRSVLSQSSLISWNTMSPPSPEHSQELMTTKVVQAKAGLQKSASYSPAVPYTTKASISSRPRPQCDQYPPHVCGRRPSTPCWILKMPCVV